MSQRPSPLAPPRCSAGPPSCGVRRAARSRCKAALADGGIGAFSGRPARGLLNAFMRAHQDPPAAYPEINNATRPIRAAAAAAGDADRMSLWAGRGFRAATTHPAGEVIEMLCAQVCGWARYLANKP